MQKLSSTRLWILLALSFTAPTLLAAKSSLNFLDKTDINVDTALSAPPADNSSAQTADLNQVLAYQTSRTDADCTRATSEENPTLGTLFGPEYGPLTQDQVDQWTSFFKKVMSDVDYFADGAKSYWTRPRPFMASSDVDPCISKPSGYSYPSAHATISRVFAHVLSQLLPSQQQDFFNRADQVALDRVMGGVHYPTDIAAGKDLGDQIFAQLQQSAEYQSALSALPSGTGLHLNHYGSGRR